MTNPHYTNRKTNDYWQTPPGVIDWAREYFLNGDPFFVDAAGNLEDVIPNAVPWGEVADSLTFNWTERLIEMEAPNKTIWCNPPYSKVEKFIDKAIEAINTDYEHNPLAGTQDLTIVMLVKSATETQWFRKAANHPHCDTIFLYPRIPFIHPDYPGHKSTGGFGSAILHFHRKNFGGTTRTWTTWKIRSINTMTQKEALEQALEK